MTRALALLLLLPSLAAAQSVVTEAQRNGLIKSAQDAVAAVNAGGTISRPTQTRLTFGANITAAQVTAGAKCILCSIFVDEAQGDWLGVPRTYFDADASRRYALMRVCGAPETRAEAPPDADVALGPRGHLLQDPARRDGWYPVRHRRRRHRPAGPERGYRLDRCVLRLRGLRDGDHRRAGR